MSEVEQLEQRIQKLSSQDFSTASAEPVAKPYQGRQFLKLAKCYIPDLESCSAFGSTPEEALSELEIAKKAWLEAARQAGKPIPVPRYRPAIYRTARWSSASGPRRAPA